MQCVCLCTPPALNVSFLTSRKATISFPIIFIASTFDAYCHDSVSLSLTYRSRVLSRLTVEMLLQLGSCKRRTHTCAEGSMRVTLSGFGNCIYPSWSCHADFTSPEASRTGLDVQAMSSALCFSKQMTASISKFTACSGRSLTPLLGIALAVMYQLHAGEMPMGEP